ncbi:MAG: carbon starvation CstA 5TM domain-containing protein [Nitrospiraceae bacterium]
MVGSAYLIGTGSISTIWPIPGVANQLLGTLALCIATTVLIKMWKSPYLWVTALPMLFVGLHHPDGLVRKMFGMFMRKAATLAAGIRSVPRCGARGGGGIVGSHRLERQPEAVVWLCRPEETVYEQRGVRDGRRWNGRSSTLHYLSPWGEPGVQASSGRGCC